MPSAQLKGAKSLLSRSELFRNAVCLTVILAALVLPTLSSKTQIGSATAGKPSEIQWPSSPLAAAMIKPSTDTATHGKRLIDQSDHSSPPAGQRHTPSDSPAKQTESETDVTIIPKIDVYVSAPYLWADGQTPAIINISLKAVKGNETWNYAPREELVFQLEPHNALFSPARVRIAPGSTTSEPASLTAKRPGIVPLTCTPERKYAGLTITTPPPENVEFITPIDAIGIESSTDTCQVNTAVPLEIFLYNQKDPQKTRLRPRSPVSVQLTSESANGKIIAVQPVELTEAEFSKYVNYVGTKTGKDTVKAIASYKDSQIVGTRNREIVFPLSIFLFGLVGCILGSTLRAYQTDPSERIKTFLESLFYGGVICIILIIYPVGTKLPEISNYIQPLLIFVLGALVSAYGPPSLHWALSFIPKGAGQQNG